MSLRDLGNLIGRKIDETEVTTKETCIKRSGNTGETTLNVSAKTEFNENHSYILISNIPKKMRSAELRRFFSMFVEEGCFDCFHFRHRPDINNMEDTHNQVRTCCCFIKIKRVHKDSFIRKYNGQQWSDLDKYLKTTVTLIPFSPKKTGAKSNSMLSDSAKLTLDILKSGNLQLDYLENMIEMNPPGEVMPQGNVGTTTRYFLNLIKQCKMPASVIKNLDIQFPKSHSKNRYGNVPFDYEVQNLVIASVSQTCRIAEKKANLKTNSSSKWNSDILDPKTEHDKVLDDPDVTSICTKSVMREKVRNIDRKHLEKSVKTNVKSGDVEEKDEEFEAEDWERHQALHEDEHLRNRNKERVFEEEMEVVWDKGSSGLVFYTDEQYWREVTGKNCFDEDTVDDWDVDYSVYYEEGVVSFNFKH